MFENKKFTIIISVIVVLMVVGSVGYAFLGTPAKESIEDIVTACEKLGGNNIDWSAVNQQAAVLVCSYIPPAATTTPLRAN